jgi:hypothetical protein
MPLVGTKRVCPIPKKSAEGICPMNLRTAPHATPPTPPPATSFSLPMMTIFSVMKHPDRSVAHALHFDLVTVGATEDEALRLLRKAVKDHVEFGLNNNCPFDILCAAPPEAWASMTTDATLRIGEPITVENYTLLTGTRTIEDETKLSLSAA